jgi:spore maturation protein CgeB
MNILVVSNSAALRPQDRRRIHNTNDYRLRALEVLGHTAVMADVRAYFFHPRLRQYWPALEDRDMARINRSLVRRAAEIRPDICLVVGGVEVSAETLRQIRGLGIPLVLWTSDAPHPQYFRHIVQTAALYDRVFCAGTEAIELLSRGGFQGAIWLPFAADPEWHCPCVLTPAEYAAYHRGVSFVGAYYPNRRDVLGSIAEFHPGIWGPQWHRVGKNSPLSAYIDSRPVDVSEWQKIYAAADIALVLHYQDGQIPCYQASPKLFEAMACGAFVLCDRQRDAEMLFKDGEHLVFFDNASDLKDKIRFYREHASERVRIAAAGRQEVLTRHTYTQRLRVLLEARGQ